MRIGIDGSRAFVKNRTGIEEYSYQVIKHLKDKLNSHQVVLYVRKGQELSVQSSGETATKVAVRPLRLPKNWKIKVIKFPYLWTQLGLSLEMLFSPVDTLFIPAHTAPFIHPENTIVTIHGLEYEFIPGAYSFWGKLYMRWSIKKSCKWAKTIISVSENTKKDLMNLYQVLEDKIAVIYEGYDRNFQFPLTGQAISQSNFNDKISKPYLLFIGRLEERKNIVGIIKAFEILKEKYEIPHRLILAGKFGYGEEKIKDCLSSSSYKSDTILPGFVGEEKKWEFLKNADVFLFPTFYEGFGLPVSEAQSAGVPVVAGNNSSIPEIANVKIQPLKNLRLNLGESQNGYSVILVDPGNTEQIADAAYKLISDKNLRDDIIKKGYENVRRFSWDKCASEIAEILMNK